MPVNLSIRDFDPAIHELMDVAEKVDEPLIQDLANLRQLNRWFGSYRLIRYYLSKLIKPGSQHHILDLCTGSGDIPRLIVDWCRLRNVSIAIDAYDFQQSTLTVARHLSESYPEISWHQKDAKSLTSNTHYTGVICSLALHHFSRGDAVLVLQNMRNSSDGFTLVADLERNYLTWLGVRLVTSTIYREPMTVNDALLSVRRSFSWNEFETLAIEAGWEIKEHRRFLYGRQAILG